MHIPRFRDPSTPQTSVYLKPQHLEAEAGRSEIQGHPPYTVTFFFFFLSYNIPQEMAYLPFLGIC